jgi:hypothetical protein
MVAYLIDAFPGLSASTMSVNVCIRYLAASLMSVLGAPMGNVLGNGWTFTLLALLNVVGACLLVVIYYKGKGWREKAGIREMGEKTVDSSNT